MRVHEVCKIFPDMAEDEFQALKIDIEENGQLEAIWTHEDKIIDGRHRAKACKELRLEPKSKKWNGKGSLIGFVISLNLKRRHLSTGQRSTCAINALPHYEDEAKKRQIKHGGTAPGKKSLSANLHEVKGKASEMAAKDFGVSARSIYAAKQLAKESPKLFAAVRENKVTLNKAMKQVHRDDRRKAPPPIPAGKYRVFYADPPWKYADKLIDGYGAAEHHYPSMSIDDLCAMPVKSRAAKDSVLFLWVTSPILSEIWPLIGAWGFKYKTSFVWDKIKHNMGHYNSVRHELLLVCTRGSCLPDSSKLIDSVQSIERTAKHSEKPEQFRKIIDQMYTNGPKIELFSRAEKMPNGWKVWGDESA